MRTTMIALTCAIATLILGCGEGVSGDGTGALAVIAATPSQNSPNATLVGEVSVTVSDALLASSVNNDTVTLTPEKAATGHSGHGAPMPGMSSTNSSLSSIGGADLDMDDYLTPSGSVRGTAALDPADKSEKTIIFTPTSPLMPGTKYSLSVHGLKTKAGKSLTDHAIPLTFTTAASVAARMVEVDTVNTPPRHRTSLLEFNDSLGAHVVKRYSGQFMLGETPPDSALTGTIRHNASLIGLTDAASANAYITDKAISISLDKNNLITRYEAKINSTGPGNSTVTAVVRAVDKGFTGNNVPDMKWGDENDLISEFTITTGKLGKTYEALFGGEINNPDAKHRFSERDDVSKFLLDEINVMFYDPADAKTLFKHIRFSNTGDEAALAQSNATQLLSPTATDVKYYHDYRYTATNSVSTRGRLAIRVRAKPSGTSAPYGASDTMTECREVSYFESSSALANMVNVVKNYRYSGTSVLVPNANAITCPVNTNRTLRSYTQNDYNTNGTLKIITTKKPTGADIGANNGANDTLTNIIYFEPMTMNMN